MNPLDFNVDYSFQTPLPESPIVEIPAKVAVSAEISVIREGKVVQTVYTTILENKEEV